MTPSSTSSDVASSRLQPLDGLRGIAASVVVLMHFLCTFFPDLVFGSHGASGTQWQDTLSRSPLFVLWNGSFAVYVFFVLSGFVIAASARRTRVPLSLLIGRRYLRLTLPALASTLVAFVLLQIFPDVTQRLAVETNNGWLIKYYNRELSPIYASIDGIFNPYRFGEVYSNSVLWTMQYELFGSLSIYLIYRLCPPKWRTVVLVSVLVVLIPQEGFLVGFVGFAAGALIYEAYISGFLKPAPPMLALMLFVVAVCLGALPQQPVENSYFAPLAIFVASFSSPPEFIYSMGAIMLLLGCLTSRMVVLFLETAAFRFLGRISFGIYLIHWPLLALPFIALYYGIPSLQSGFGFVGYAGLYAVTVIVSAYVFTRLVDEPVIDDLRRVQIQDRSRYPKILFLGHSLVVSVFLAFIVSRLGVDPPALVVWSIAYLGFIVVTMRVYDVAIPERAVTTA